MMRKFSDCCGASNKSVGEDGQSWEDVGICPNCMEECLFNEEDDNEPIPNPYSEIDDSEG